MSICCTGPNGEDNINSMHFAATTANVAPRSRSSIYNCSTRLCSNLEVIHFWIGWITPATCSDNVLLVAHLFGPLMREYLNTFQVFPRARQLVPQV